jgi:exosome complex component CSL4
MAEVAVVGERLGQVREYAAGPGTHVSNNHIHASVIGLKRVVASVEEGGLPVMQIMQDEHRFDNQVLRVGHAVTGRVTRVNARMASMDILCVRDVPLKEKHTGTIRKEDVRSVEIDKVEIGKCFRPGDLVRASVISLGDSRAYYLTTAKEELGVIMAKSAAGATMLPVSWQEMECPVSKIKEPRKVARVFGS